MRGVYYRTEKDGTPLATPELRISATNNRTVYYDNQNAKEAALQNDEIKEGSIVLTGYADGESEVVIKQEPDWDNAETITVAQINAGYTAPDDGMIVGYMTTAVGMSHQDVTINGVVITTAYYNTSGGGDTSFANIQVAVKKGDILKSTNIYANDTKCSFVPFKTVAEPLTLPVNVMNNPSLPDYSRAVAIDVSTLHTTGYVVPADGYLVGNFWANGTTAVDYMYVNSNIVAVATWTSGGGHMRGMLQCPVAKNNIITCDAALSTGSSIKFVPFKN